MDLVAASPSTLVVRSHHPFGPSASLSRIPAIGSLWTRLQGSWGIGYTKGCRGRHDAISVQGFRNQDCAREGLIAAGGTEGGWITWKLLHELRKNWLDGGGISICIRNWDSNSIARPRE